MNLQEIGIKGVIDAHSHAGGTDYYNLFTGNLPVCQSVDDLLLKAKLTGVEKNITFPMPSTNYYDYKFLVSDGQKRPSGLQDFPYQKENESLLLACRYVNNPDTIFPFACVDPTNKQNEQLDYLSNLKKEKKIFGLKLHTLATSSTALDLEKGGFVDFALENKLPIMIHSGLNDTFSHPKNIIELASKYPQLRLCIAHLAWLDQDTILQISKKSNIFIDTSPFLQICDCVERRDHAVNRFNLIDPTNPPASLLKYFNLLKDNLIWGTDEPWTKCINSNGKISSNHTYFEEVDNLIETFKLNPEAVYKITNENTLKFLFG